MKYVLSLSMALTHCLTLALLMACGAQDPLQDFPSSVREAIPISQKIERPPETPVDSDVMTIDGPEVVNFTEGVEGSFRVSGRLLGIDAPYEIKIANPPDGMTFDPNTGEVRWTPSTTTVTGDDAYSKYLLYVDMIAHKEGEPLAVRKEIVLFVNIASPPLSQHLLNIAVEPKVVTFTEGKPGTFRLIGQFFSGATAPYKINILNPPPGADIKNTSDGVQVTWTPPYSTITGMEQFGSYPLHVTLVAQGENGEVSIERTIDLGVYTQSPPLAQHHLDITSDPSIPNFVEGVPGTFVISGQLSGGVTASHEITILNLPEGASQKAVADGTQVTWTPPYSTITGENQFFSSYPLQVQMTARDQESEVSRTRTIPLGVRVAHPPLSKKSLDIEVNPSFPVFVEGVQGTFTLAGQLLGGVEGSHQITILNLPEGASQTVIAGGIQVTWTPPYSTIIGEKQFSTSYPLQVQMTARDQESEITIDRTIALGVHIDRPPLTSKLMAIKVSPEMPHFIEGVQGTFTISGHLLGGASGSKEITILNLPEGASQKAVTGGIEVTWTPPYSTITGENQFSTTLPLEVRLTARDQESEVSRTRTIPLGVRIARPPLSKKSLDIEVNPSLPVFVEGVQGTFTLSGQLLGGVEGSHQITILNLPEGASQTVIASGIQVTWTPPYSTITGENQFSTSYPLQVQMTARDQESEITIDRTITLGIHIDRPPLTSKLMAIKVSPEMPHFIEGTKGTFTLSGKLLGGVTAAHEITILNLPEGASQKAVADGIEVTWTPPYSTITGTEQFTSTIP